MSGAGGSADGVGHYRAMADGGCHMDSDSLALAVLDRLLWVGVPQSPQTSPLIADATLSRQLHTPSLDRIRGPEGLTFILETSPAEDGGQLVKVNLSGLRRWLEREGLTRRFGVP